MTLLRKMLVAVSAGTMLATSAFAQSKAIIPIENEPAPKLIVDPPVPGPLARGAVLIPYRVEHLRIMPVLGAAARNVYALARAADAYERMMTGEALFRVVLTMEHGGENLSAGTS